MTDDIVEALRHSVADQRLDRLDDLIERSVRAARHRILMRRGATLGAVLAVVAALGTVLHFAARDPGHTARPPMLASSDRVLAVGPERLSGRLVGMLSSGRVLHSASGVFPAWLSEALQEPHEVLVKYAYSGAATYRRDGSTMQVAVVLEQLDAANLASLRAGDCVQGLPPVICADFAHRRNTDFWGITERAEKTSVRVFTRMTSDGWMIQVASEGTELLSERELRAMTESSEWLKDVPPRP